MPRRAQSARQAPPQNPKFVPCGFLCLKMNAFGEQARRLFATPIIQRVTEARTQRVAKKLEENALVLEGTPAPTGAGEQNAPQLSQGRRAPFFTRTEHSFETAP